MGTWHVHPDVIFWIALLEGGYLYAVKRVGKRRGQRVTHARAAIFAAGVAVLYIGAGTPIHDLSEHRLFMMHMIQHMLFTLVAPPLLLLGTPGWLLAPLLDRRWLLRLGRLVTRPLPAFLQFNVLLLFTHLPPVLNATLEHHPLHFVVHALLIIAAVLMWWPVLSPVREWPRISPPLQMVYLFLQSFVPSVLASFITFSSSVVYEFYAAVPRMWAMSPVDDQRYAGLIMKLGGGAILWLGIGIVFFLWVAREERPAPQPDLRWEDVEDELTRMGLTRTR